MSAGDKRRDQARVMVWGPAPLAGIRYRLACAEALLEGAHARGLDAETFEVLEAALAESVTERPADYDQRLCDALRARDPYGASGTA